MSRVLKMEKQLLSVDTAQANGLHLTPLIRKPTFLTKNLRLLIKLNKIVYFFNYQKYYLIEVYYMLIYIYIYIYIYHNSLPQ